MHTTFAFGISTLHVNDDNDDDDDDEVVNGSGLIAFVIETMGEDCGREIF